MKLNRDKSIKRYEIKFIFTKNNENYFDKIKNLKKIFPDRVVESIYYDTNQFKFFSLSEEGITPRIKVRIRGYNNGFLNNLEIKKTNNYDREKIVIKNFENSFVNFYKSLKKIGIDETLHEKLRVKYDRSYYHLKNIGRITYDKNIQFSLPGKNKSSPISIDNTVMEVKVNSVFFDKVEVEKKVGFKESRFSKYCFGINKIYN
tara:strand:+ start:53360 stop:53968 length:609 start_codon:yes stop_codon:yes gene_type:complete